MKFACVSLRSITAAAMIAGLPGIHLPTATKDPTPKNSVMPDTFTNPINDKDMPDPGVLFADGAYWSTHTMGRLPACPLWKSPDMVHWQFDRHLLDSTNAPSWVHDRYWAPELHKVGGTYILLFTSGDTTGRLCIGAGTASRVTGPYTILPEPLVSTPGMGVIDPTLFEDTDGKVYLLWKDDGNDQGKPCHIFIQEMDKHHPGTRFAAGSSPKVLIVSSPSGWENGIVEGPEMVKKDGWYYLFYSGSGFTNNYAEGVARSRNILAGFEKCPQNPILKGSQSWANPGHGSFLTDADGATWFLYHAYHRNDMRRGRVQLLDRVYFGPNDEWPRIGNHGVPTESEQPAPVIHK